MPIEIIHNKEPKLKRPVFLVDGELSEKLNDYEITKLMNKSNFTLFLAKPGSGKTSQIVAFLNTPTLFKQVYHTIYLFMKPNSRTSIKGSFFDKEIPSDQVFDELTFDNLNNVFERIKDDAEEGYKSLIIMDDVQAQMKNKDVEKLLLELVMNRRHLLLSIWTANQSIKSIPIKIRSAITDAFIWKISKKEMEIIFEEVIEQPKDIFNEVLTTLFKTPHSFFFVNIESKRMFNNWDELAIEE
jgi:hypothetical protein